MAISGSIFLQKERETGQEGDRETGQVVKRQRGRERETEREGETCGLTCKMLRVYLVLMDDKQRPQIFSSRRVRSLCPQLLEHMTWHWSTEGERERRGLMRKGREGGVVPPASLMFC
jgi:hypothetical protein